MLLQLLPTQSVTEIQLDLNNLKKLYDRGYIIQLDAGSLLGHFGLHVKACCEQIVSQGLFHLIGSDAHNNKTRNFCLKDVLKLNNSVINNNRDIIFNTNPTSILKGKNIKSILLTKNKKSFGFFFNFIRKAYV